MLYKFLIAVIITIAVLVSHQAVKPISGLPEKNFVPLLSTFPSKAQIPRSRCDALTRCDDGVGCAMCGSDHECTPIENHENVIFKGQKVPAGLWCLPKGKRNLSCGTFTGRAIWTKDRGWECACLYPDLFAGSDCNQQIACRLPGKLSTNSKLKNKRTGHVWDPSDPQFNPSDTTPYDHSGDERNPAAYQCECVDEESSTLLPGDPYRCHRDPCTSDQTIAMWDARALKCDCTAKGKTNNQYAYSNVTKRCVRTEQCNWDDNEQKCLCPEGQVSKTCNSDTMRRTDTTESCPNISGGSYCSNPCEGYCQNGSIPTVVGNKCFCKCINRGNVIVSGNRCENSCLKDGSILSNGEKCCNGVSRVRAANHSYKVCGPSSCFVKGSTVTMFSGIRDKIENVKRGDVVMSAFGRPTNVLMIDKTVIGERDIVGFNGLEPFITEDHCVVGEDGPRRLTFNAFLAKEQKHWNVVDEVTPGDRVVGIGEIRDIIRKTIPKDTEVYDVITSDHTLIVNGVGCYDDMPEVENHPYISVIMARLLKCVNTKAPITNIPKYVDNLFFEKLREVLLDLSEEERTIGEVFEQEFPLFIERAAEDNKLLHVASNLWKNKFEDLELMERMTFLLCENHRG